MADKTNTIFRALDRKASAITEFTMRQYRTKISTWVVLITGLVIISLLMMFYVDAMQRDFESVDNDGDSVDSDGDSYPDGQERLYGTNPFSALSNPGFFDPPIPPDDPSVWIDEDDFDWNESPTGTRSVSVGYDDDGDCRTDDRTSSQKDTNDNGVECDIELSLTLTGEFRYEADSFVDEDPDDEAYAKEALHRASILGIGKLGFVFIISIFIPLFMATGLIRDEMNSGTMHYMLTKPIARTEVFLLPSYWIPWYRLAIFDYIDINFCHSHRICRARRLTISVLRIWHMACNTICCHDGNPSLWYAVLLSWCDVALWNNFGDTVCCLGIGYGTTIYGRSRCSDTSLLSHWLGTNHCRFSKHDSLARHDLTDLFRVFS